MGEINITIASKDIVVNNPNINNDNSNESSNDENSNVFVDKPIVETDNKMEVDSKEETISPDIPLNSIKEFNLVALGEIMMGGEINKNVDYNYLLAFKEISDITSKGDYTVAHLATNVTKLDKIENPKSKYIVTNKIDNAFGALGIDGLCLATEHMLDFGKDIFLDTKALLEDDYDLIGLKNNIIYVENDGIELAIIGVCNEVIGSEGAYTNAGIMVYNMAKLKEMIKEAKQNAQAVILMTHLGYENTHQITSIMDWFYKELIKAGADLVIGSHSIGVYPIEIYNGKPIIYSLGYLMHDTNYEVGKKSGIFNFKFNEIGKLVEIKVTPTYINAKKQTLLYSEYDKNGANEFLKYIAGDLNNCSINDNVLTVNLDK